MFEYLYRYIYLNTPHDFNLHICDLGHSIQQSINEHSYSKSSFASDCVKVSIRDDPSSVPSGACCDGVGAGGCARRHSLSRSVAVTSSRQTPGPEALSEAPPAAYNSWAGVSPWLQSGLCLRQTCFASSVSSSPQLASSVLANLAVSVSANGKFSDFCVMCLSTINYVLYFFSDISYFLSEQWKFKLLPHSLTNSNGFGE